jgi:hypothetical protein
MSRARMLRIGFERRAVFAAIMAATLADALVDFVAASDISAFPRPIRKLVETRKSRLRTEAKI